MTESKAKALRTFHSIPVNTFITVRTWMTVAEREGYIQTNSYLYLHFVCKTGWLKYHLQ